MTTVSDLASGSQGESPESLLTLAKYLELSLDAGTCIVMMRRASDVVSIILGEPTGDPKDLKDLKDSTTITTALADEILELTKSGTNQVTVGDIQYRFFRSFTHIAGVGAVVFAPA